MAELSREEQRRNKLARRKQAAQVPLEANVELQETRRYLTRLIEGSPYAIIATNRDGNVVLFNRGAEALLGYRSEEIIGKGVAQLYESAEKAKEVTCQMRYNASCCTSSLRLAPRWNSYA